MASVAHESRVEEEAGAPHAMPSIREVATFWHGPPLGGLEIACLTSFVRAGFRVSVYRYDDTSALPHGMTSEDAAAIVDRSWLDRFIVKGRPSLAHFSDYFRYCLFAVRRAAWVDADLLCLAPFDIPGDANFLARETETSINNAVLWLDPARPDYTRLVEAARAFGSGDEFEWGATGPALVTSVLGSEALAAASQPARFYPIPWDAWWKPFVPSSRDECEALAENATGVHLWNNIVERSGYWKDLAPPAGSYLHGVLDRLDLLGPFVATCPARVMEHIAQNYRESRTASHMRVGQLGRITAQRAWAAVQKRVR